MIDMIVDEFLFRIFDSANDGMHLLGNINTGVLFLYHCDDLGEMSSGPFKPFNDIIMTAMYFHILSSRIGYI